MKVLVLGSGGREHALVWKIRQSPLVKQVHCVPGNAGMAQDATLERGDITSPAAMAELAARLGVELTVVGPEAPLVAGVADEFAARGLPLLGPTKAAAQLEGSKIFAKQFMKRHGIPTADFVVCETAGEVEANIGGFGFPVVLKADGLAAGKGVVVAPDRDAALETARQMLSGQLVGDAGRRLLLERFLPGEEVSFIVLTDGHTMTLALPPTQDHKAVFDNDQGPNTGGMGAYCDDAILSSEMRERVMRSIVQPTVDGMRAEGAPFRGFLYCGLMMTAQGPQVLEYNVRCGDPEAQPIVMRLTTDLVPLMMAIAQTPAERQSRSGGPSATIEAQRGASACVVLASGGYPGKYETGKVITGLEEADAHPEVKVFHAGTRRQDGNYVTAGGRVLGVTARGSDLREALERAYAAVQLIHFDGMHYRRDIGHKGLARH
jgi:phosphoribosylamine--glycine ligase